MYLNNRFSSPENQAKIIELRQYFPMDLLKSLTQNEIQKRRAVAESDYALLQSGGTPTLLQKEYDGIEKNYRAQMRGKNTMLVVRAIAWWYKRKAEAKAKIDIEKQILAAMQDNYWQEEEKNILEDVPDQIIIGWLETVLAGTPPNRDSQNQPTSHEFNDELYPTQKIPDATKHKTWTDYSIRHTASHLDPIHSIALLKHFLNNVRKAASDEDILLPNHRRLSVNLKGIPTITLRYHEK